jgi:hypothetical protein
MSSYMLLYGCGDLLNLANTVACTDVCIAAWLSEFYFPYLIYDTS